MAILSVMYIVYCSIQIATVQKELTVHFSWQKWLYKCAHYMYVAFHLSCVNLRDMLTSIV